MNNIYILNDKSIEGVENIPLIKIIYLKNKIDIKNYDALIFTSKNGIYSLNSFNQDWKNIPSYVISNKTKEVLLKIGGKLKFTGKSNNGDDFANELIDILSNKQVLYIRSEKILSNITNILKKNDININELITYKTICNKTPNTIKIPPSNSIIIFSSPSTINCFFNIYKWNYTYKAIVIGETTASYMQKYISNYDVSEELSIESCIKKAKDYI